MLIMGLDSVKPIKHSTHHQASLEPSIHYKVKAGVAAMSSSEIVSADKAKPEKRRAVHDTGKAKHARLDPHSITHEQVVVFKEIYTTLATANVASLALHARDIQEKSQIVKDVHPLGFLHLIHLDHKIKEHLVILKSSWVITQPWTRTHEDFAIKMGEHKKNDSLHLDFFLEKLDKVLHAPIREKVEKSQFKDLLEMFLPK